MSDTATSATADPTETVLKLRIDPRKWQQVRAVCHRLAGRELTDVECFTMLAEQHLMKHGLYTRTPYPQISRKK